MAGKIKTCRANVGTRTEPRLCADPLAKGMRAACDRHKTRLIATSEPGIYYRGGGYVVVSRRQGRQVKEFFRDWNDAKEARGKRQSGDSRAALKQPFNTYATNWIDRYQGRTDRGFDEDTRAAYKRALELWAIPHLQATRIDQMERDQINALIRKMQQHGLSPREHLEVHGAGPGDVVGARRGREAGLQPRWQAADQREGRQPADTARRRGA
jgi:hypothetical protein